MNEHVIVSGASAVTRGVDSIWTRTGPAPSYPRLQGDITVEVAIIGAGFTGLSLAHHLAELGIDCAVLEARQPGFGCSGRNGGFAVTRYKKGFGTLAAKYGTATALHMHRMMLEGIDLLDLLVERYAIDCDLRRAGHLTAAATPKSLHALGADVEWLRREAGDTVPKMLSKDEVAEGLGIAGYHGGYLDSRAIHVHPLKYAAGLAAGVASRGVAIYGDSPVLRVTREAGGVIAQTASGTLRARQLVVATNGYSTAVPGLGDLHRRVVPVASSIVTTEALDAATLRSVLPAGWAVGDTKYIMNSFCMLPGGHLMFAGRGDITGRLDSPETYRNLEAKLAQVFPQLAGAAIAARWSGMVAVTLDDIPHIGSLDDRIHFAMGYGGRGVVLAPLLGRYLTRLISGQAPDAGPLSSTEFKPVPFHGLRIPGMKATALYYQFRDAVNI